MADPKSLRQVAAQQANAAKQRQVKRPEEMDEQVVPAEGAEASAQPVAEAAPVAEASGGSSGSGPSYGLVGAGALGALGLIAAVAGGGGGGKSGDAKPPVAEIPKPEQPKPQEPKPEEPKPVEPKPQEPKTGQPQPVEPKPEEPKSEQPQPVEPKPEEPKTEQPQPVEPKPEEPKTEQPHPVEPKPEEPKTEQPQPAEPKPEEPKTEQPQPVEPKPEEPKTEQPHPVEHKPEEPKSEQPKPVEPKSDQQKPEDSTSNQLRVLEAKLAVDSGFSASDHITNQANVVISGLQATDSWRYSCDGGKTWTEGSGANAAIAGDAFGENDGEKSLIVEQLIAGSPVRAQEHLNFVLDRQAFNIDEIFEGFNRFKWRILGERPVIDLNFELGAKIEYSLSTNGYLPRWDDSSKWKVADHDEVIDFIKGVDVVGADIVTFFVKAVDAAGNEFRYGDNVVATPIYSVYGAQKYADPSSLVVGLISEASNSELAIKTSNPMLKVENGIPGMSWKYSLDDGATWKEGTSNWTIASSEFVSSEGHKHVLVKQINALGKEGAITQFNFTLQPEEILGTPSTESPGSTTFNGTTGMDRFIVKSADGLHIGLTGYAAEQGDVIDLSNVLKIESGKSVDQYLSKISGQNGSVIVVVNESGLDTRPDEQLIIGLGNQATLPQVTILYDGGKVIL